MIIEQIDGKRLLISLKEEDMKAYAVNIEKLNIKDEASRSSLKALLKYACSKVGLELSKKAVLVEAMPHKEGVLILVTIEALEKLRKTYKVKKQPTLPCCRFDSAEKLLSCVEKLKKEQLKLQSNSLWRLGGEYYLLFNMSGLSSRASVVLSEYGRCMSLSLSICARIREAGVELENGNAVEKIGSFL